MTDAWIFLGLAALGAGIAFAGTMIGVGLHNAAQEKRKASEQFTATFGLAVGKIGDHISSQIERLATAHLDLMQYSLKADANMYGGIYESIERAAERIRRGLRAQSRATKFDARVRAGIIHRKVRVAEKSAEEKLVDQFMSEGGAKLNDDEKLELEWALGRLRGADPEQGSISRALSVLEKFKCPRPPDITDEMVAHLLETEDFEA